MSFAAVAIGGGLALGAGASYLGSRSANKAANKQLDQQSQLYQDQQNRLGMLMFGPQDWADFQQSLEPDSYTTTSKSGGLAGLFGGTKKKTVNQAAQNAAARARFFGKYGTTQQNIGDLNKGYSAQLDNDLGTMQKNTQQLDALARGSEDAVSDFGNEGEARVREEMARANTAANQQSTAALSGLGMNTLGANQVAQNNRLFAGSTQDAITNLRNIRLGRFQQARTQRLGLLSGRRGVEDAARANTHERQYALNREPTDMMANLFNQGSFQPYTPLQGGSQSPIGNAFGSAAGGVGQLGGQLMGQNFLQQLLAKK